MPDAVDLIRAKRDGGRLPAADIGWLIAAYTDGVIADEQMSALLMAIFFRGLDPAELMAWTDAMISSGERLDLSGLSVPTVDKHSTGGVGDKVSLILAPLVASCGAAVPQLSGRGLGHTGGTLDKLESIPGWRASLSNAEIVSRARGDRLRHLRRWRRPRTGRPAALRAPGRHRHRRVHPADRQFDHVQEDCRGNGVARPRRQGRQRRVHAGPGRGPASSRETMVELGNAHGVRTSALLTRMDTPLGRAVGNAVEVEESVATLRGAGPADLVEVTLALAAEMLAAGWHRRRSGRRARRRARAWSGTTPMIAAQGGDPARRSCRPRGTRRSCGPRRPAGSASWSARAVGVAAWRLGAGRARKEDPVSAAAGIICLAKPGERSRPASRCSSCAATTRASSTAPSRRSRARSRLARNRPSQPAWCSTGSGDSHGARAIRPGALR